MPAITIKGSNKGARVARPRSKEPNPRTPSGQWSLYLAHLMERRGFTADSLAAELGRSRSIVFRWLRGDSIPPVDHWPLIAEALGLSNWTELTPPLKFITKL